VESKRAIPTYAELAVEACGEVGGGAPCLLLHLLHVHLLRILFVAVILLFILISVFIIFVSGLLRGSGGAEPAGGRGRSDGDEQRARRGSPGGEREDAGVSGGRVEERRARGGGGGSHGHGARRNMRLPGSGRG
jgi:hypothetical protein